MLMDLNPGKRILVLILSCLLSIRNFDKAEQSKLFARKHAFLLRFHSRFLLHECTVSWKSFS